jgi:hypothetical protein
MVMFVWKRDLENILDHWKLIRVAQNLEKMPLRVGLRDFIVVRVVRI